VTSCTPDRPAGGQAAEEAEPAGAVLGGGDVQAEDLAVPVAIDTDGDQAVDVDDPSASRTFKVSASAQTKV
jgi:hypothetical protein